MENTPNPAPLLLTAEAAAERLNISRTRVYELLASRTLNSVKIGRLRRIRPEDLDAFVRGLMEGDSHDHR